MVDDDGSGTVQISVRVSGLQKLAIEAHGGLTKVTNKFLKEHAGGNEERLRGGRDTFEERRKEIHEEKRKIEKKLKELDTELIRVDVNIAGIDKGLSLIRSNEQKALEHDVNVIKESTFTIKRMQTKAHKSKSPAEWERDNKPMLLIQHAATNDLKQADRERIVQKMKIRPDVVIGWLYSPLLKNMPIENLEKVREKSWGTLPSLQILQKENRIREPLYKLLTGWLKLSTEEEVNTWIKTGSIKKEVPHGIK